MDGILILLATSNIALEIRGTMHVFQVLIVAVWVLIAVLSLWAILRRWKTPRLETGIHEPHKYLRRSSSRKGRYRTGRRRYRNANFREYLAVTPL
jgi:hypothetical protein